MTVFLISKEPTDILLPVWPAIGTFPVIKVVDKGTAIVLMVLFHPVFTMLVLAPFGQSDKVRALTITLVVSPLTDIQLPTTVPVSTAAGANAAIEIAIIRW